MKLYKQTDKFRCGPIAIANAWRLVGIETFAFEPITRKMINTTLSDIVECEYPDGTDPRILFRFLEWTIRMHDWKCRRVISIQKRQLDKALAQGAFAVIQVDYDPPPDFEGHYFIIDKRVGKKYHAINLSWAELLSADDLQYMLNRSKMLHKKYPADCQSMTLLVWKGKE